MNVSIKEITDAEYEAEVLNSDTPVVVDFWAPWCGPCKAMAPTLDAIATEYAGKVKVVKINVDEHKETAKLYGVRGIPTLMLVRGGKMVEKQVGTVPASVITGWLN